MRKFVFVLLEVIGFVLKAIFVCSLLIIGIDLVSRKFEENKETIETEHYE